jgi:hypothetical protein
MCVLLHRVPWYESILHVCIVVIALTQRKLHTHLPSHVFLSYVSKLAICCAAICLKNILITSPHEACSVLQITSRVLDLMVRVSSTTCEEGAHCSVLLLYNAYITSLHNIGAIQQSDVRCFVR